MKKMIALLLAAMTLGLCACSTPDTNSSDPTEITQVVPVADPGTPLSDGKTLKLLAITSSFGLNTTELLYDIAKAEGAENIVIARLYASGCTLKAHYENASGNLPAYQYTKNNAGTWEKIENATMEYGIKDEDWDIIFMQQSAHNAGRIATYATAAGEDYIDLVKAYVDKTKTNPNARYIWNMTWAFQQDNQQAAFLGDYQGNQMTMYNMILDCTKEKAVPRTDFAAIIPTGTAIQNARTSYFGDTLTKDTLHLNNLGRVIAGYTVWATVTGKPLTGVNVGPVNSYDLPDMLELSVTDRQVIMEAVNNALESPFAVTPSTYTEAH